MITTLFVFFCYCLTQFAAYLVAEGRNRVHLWQIITIAWGVGLPLLAEVDAIFPFSGGGDDENYYFLALASVNSISELLDLTRFVGVMEQPGYPWLLSLVNYFANSELLSFKILNLTLYILLAVVWYRIGTLLQDSAFGRKAMLTILLLTPLWYYFFFLRKDLVIVLLQSIFLLGLVKIIGHNTFRAWFFVVASIMALLLFRTPLVFQSLAVLVATLLLSSFSQGGKGMILMQLSGGLLTWGLLTIGSSQEIMAIMGIYSEHRLLGSSSMGEALSATSEASQMSKTLFPLLYLLSETSGLSPKAWTVLDPSWLRGLLALPWLFVVPPFFVAGIIWLTQSPRENKDHRRQYRDSRVIATPWSALVVFVISYIAISWNVGDTTRWRIPDMPVIAVISLAGWHFTQPRIRRLIYTLWFTGASIFISLNILINS